MAQRKKPTTEPIDLGVPPAEQNPKPGKAPAKPAAPKGTTAGDLSAAGQKPPASRVPAPVPQPPAGATTGTGPTPGIVAPTYTMPGATTTGPTANAYASDGGSASDVVLSVLQSQDLPPSLIATLAPLIQPLVNSTMSNAQATATVMNSPAYQNFFAGNKLAVANGYQPLAPNDYLQYMQTAEALGKAAGLPAGFIDGDTVASLIGNGVSLNEMTWRISNGIQNTQQLIAANPMIATYANAAGLGLGDIVAAMLDPTKSEALLQNNQAAAVVGGTAMEAGFQPMSAQQALQLAGLGVVGQVGGNLNPGNMQGELAKIAPDLTLTQDIQGKAGGAGGAGSLTQAQLLSAAFVGDQSSQRAAQVAQETRGAKFAGGGGPVAGNSQGGQGAGSATQ